MTEPSCGLKRRFELSAGISAKDCRYGWALLTAEHQFTSGAISNECFSRVVFGNIVKMDSTCD